MPIKIPAGLPAKDILEKENIFIMKDTRADTQDIRPLNIIILNLMPEKQKTEAHLLRYLGNTPLQVSVSFLQLATHQSKHTSKLHLDQFYQTFPEIRHKRFDGMIITGAPVEKLPFEEVDYWDELTRIMEWSKTHVTSTLHICWGAQAALHYHFGLEKHDLPEKCFGVFQHYLCAPSENLIRGFDDVFLAPHSRYTDVERRLLHSHPELTVLAESEEAGVLLIASKNGSQIMSTGHLEYDAGTLGEEYSRDRERGISTGLPKNYYPGNQPDNMPLHRWKSHCSLLFSNWLNYYVYQQTPYDWE